ncbi:MAG: argininosuccinate synthase [Omnitrophica bacterium RIFCSPLOWO2_12_FULL_50_11]|nr:MAG: argininosuccinate synthase [Omnitrophica bacterium RIFCSPLOWO2_12_FULL_50_11]
MKKVVLAYSGGLDTSCAVRWIRDTYSAEVICFSAFLGEVQDRKVLTQRARSAGASKVYIEDLKKEFAHDFVRPALWAHAKYEGKYFLATALGRPLIAKRLVQIAAKERAGCVAHGCSGKGNDQVRVELGVRSLNSKLKILAPLREWSFSSREEEIAYAKKHGILVSATKKSPYSIDKNIWGVSIEAGVLEDPWREPPEDAYRITRPPDRTPKAPYYLTIDFTAGIPVSLNGKRMSLVPLIERLNALGGRYGAGRMDLVENRLVGIKSREVYEAPAATILNLAHEELESLVLDRELMHYKRLLSEKYSELVYYGLWFTPLREALDQFFASYQNRVTGSVRMKLQCGSLAVVGRRSPRSLYSERLATYSARDEFDRAAAEGFLKIWGLPYEKKR